MASLEVRLRSRARPSLRSTTAMRSLTPSGGGGEEPFDGPGPDEPAALGEGHALTLA